MKRGLRAICAGGFVALSLFGVAAAGPLEDGQAAYERGDFDSAMQLLLPLANSGDANAEYLVGLAYDIGNGVKQDHSIAAVWYRKAALQGAREAQVNLGALYARGEGVPQDYAQAAKWWRMVAG